MDGRERKVERLLKGALGRPRNEREAYVRANCSDTEVLSEVLGLLSYVSSGSNAPHGLSGPIMRLLKECKSRDAAPVEPAYRVGDRIGGVHRVTRVFALGGMGVVYVCGDEFVLKTFHDHFLRDDTVRRRFESEAILSVRMGWHPHIVTSNSVEILDGRPFINMLYVPGGRTLVDRMREAEGGVIPVAEACELAVGMCLGLEHALGFGMRAHCDLKPSNVLLAEGRLAKVGDFGLARSLTADHQAWTAGGSDDSARATCVLRTASGSRVAGTPRYMSPEHWRGSPDVRSDVYALGIILFEMLTGRHPFEECDAEAARESSVVPSSHSPLDAILSRALDSDPERRYATVADMREAIESVACRISGFSSPRIRMEAFFHSRGYRRNSLGCLWEDGKGEHYYRNLSISLHHLGRHEEAEEVLALATRDGIDSPSLWGTRALVLRRLGRLSEALELFRRVSAAKPKDALAHHNVATTYMALSRFDEALSYFDKAVALDPKQPGILSDRAFCLLHASGDRVADALRDADHAAHLAPRNPRALLVRARVLIRVGQLDAAAEILGRARELLATEDLLTAWRSVEQQLAEARAAERQSEPQRATTEGTSFPPRGVGGGLRAVEFPSTIKFPRERQARLVAQLRDVKRPTREITVQELSAAIRMSGPAIPAWVNDPVFEGELEELLALDSAWLCQSCDTIIGFFEAPPGEEKRRWFSELFLVMNAMRASCPRCGSREMSLAQAWSLRTFTGSVKDMLKKQLGE